MTEQPTQADWNDADQFWDLVQTLDPAVAWIIITTLVASTPKTLQQARNVIKGRDKLKKR